MEQIFKKIQINKDIKQQEGPASTGHSIEMDAYMNLYRIYIDLKQGNGTRRPYAWKYGTSRFGV